MCPQRQRCRVEVMKCKVDDCPWEGYTDTEKCWAHSRGIEPEPRTAIAQDDGEPDTFAAAVLIGQQNGEEWAKEWKVTLERVK